MKRYALLLALLLSLTGIAQAETPTFQAAITKEWTIDTARIEAFTEALPYIDVSRFSSIDPNLIENRQILQNGGGRIGDRYITLFDVLPGAYCVADAKSPQISFYYSAEGKLITLDIHIGTNYPKKNYKYAATDEFGAWKKGQLLSVGINVGRNDIYSFNTDGTLNVHWISNKCYQVDGSSCGTRKALGN